MRVSIITTLNKKKMTKYYVTTTDLQSTNYLFLIPSVSTKIQIVSKVKKKVKKKVIKYIRTKAIYVSLFFVK